MQSIFEPAAFHAILERIDKLQDGAPGQWGKMSVSQMLLHCQQPVKVALGEIQLKHSFLGKLFGGMAKRSLMQDKPFRKNLPTAPEFLVKTQPAFDHEKQQLKSLVKRLHSTDKHAIAAIVHPFFGKMTAEEWGLLNWKHLDHHLQQFGA
jgi:Protein of unknown function (DUF1569)